MHLTVGLPQPQVRTFAVVRFGGLVASSKASMAMGSLLRFWLALALVSGFSFLPFH